MFLCSNIELDPSQLTVMRKVKQDGFWSEVIDFLSFGLTSEKLEQETFSAVNILQQIHMALMSAGLDNIIKLSIDNHDFFIDNHAQEADLDKAMMSVEYNLDPIGSKYFEEILLLLEHKDELLKYLIEIKILRKHRLAEYPIKICINAVFNELNTKHLASVSSLDLMMNDIFSSQQSYDEFIAKHEAKYKAFVDNLEHNLARIIKVDGIINKYSPKIIRPVKSMNSLEDIEFVDSDNPIFTNYPGFQTAFFYCWKWAQHANSKNMGIKNVAIIDHRGNDIFSIGDVNYYPQKDSTLDVTRSFDLPSSANFHFFTKNEYSHKIKESNVNPENNVKEESETVNFWLQNSL